MPKKYKNVIEVKVRGKKMYRARLIFPFDQELGYRPAPKNFYGKTAAEADYRRSQYVPEKISIDKRTSFVDYIRKEFLFKQEQLARAGEYSWQHYTDRKWRLEKWLLEPQDEAIKKMALRKVRLGGLRPDHIKDFFHTLLILKVAGENRRKLKDDLRVALQDVKKRIPEPWQTYFEDLKKLIPATQRTFAQRQTFDPRQVALAILDESKPLRDRALVGFAAAAMRRPSEVFALKWKDIDWERGQVPIEKRTVKTKDGMAVREGTKNKEVSVIGIGGGILNLLARLKQEPLPFCAECGEGPSAIQHRPPFDKSRRKRKEQHHRFAGKIPGEDDFVFTTERGRPLNKDNFKWQTVKKNLGLPDGPGFYSLKHMMNSELDARQISDAARADRMGHKNDQMARIVYRKVSDVERQRVVTEIDEILALAGPQEISPQQT